MSRRSNWDKHNRQKRADKPRQRVPEDTAKHPIDQVLDLGLPNRIEPSTAERAWIEWAQRNEIRRRSGF